MKQQLNRGFSIFELVAILAVIGLLTAMTINISTFAWRRMHNQRAKAEIAALESALEMYKLDNGLYPAGSGSAGSSTPVYRALTGNGKSYLNFEKWRVSGSTILDPFGSEYLYLSPGTNHAAAFDLWSCGFDRMSGTDDDVANFKAN